MPAKKPMISDSGHQVFTTALPEALAAVASLSGPESWAACSTASAPDLAALSGLPGEAERR